ncbi:MAG TPA: ABC transporter permease [Bryobacteraceae bacterium]|nr:ABC transporter permease [Bryobacteraceae bacterium]
MRNLWKDLSFAFRLLQSSPGFTVVAVLTLALGIGANATVFSWIDELLLRPFPGSTDSQQLAVLEMVTAGAPNGANQTSYLDYLDYRDHLKSISGLALHREDVFTLGESVHAQAVWGELVSGNYFAVLGMKPVLGRMFTPEENGDKLGAYPVTVIGYRLWKNYFHADRGIVGKSVRVNRRELTVVGVAPEEFRGTMPGLVFEMWVPVTMGVELGMLDDSTFKNRASRRLYGIVRLKSGVAIEQARAEAAAFSHNLEAMSPDTNRGVTAAVLPAWEFHSAAPDLFLRPLRILMAISVLVLFIVCANVANLLLARSIARRKEISIRLALGAGWWQLLRQLLTETVLLAGAGAIGGLWLAQWMGNMLPAMIPRVAVTLAAGAQLNGRILAFTILICAGATLLSGAAPALLWLRTDVNETLREGGRSGSPSAQSHRMRDFMVVAEVALATVALVGSGLFLRSFHNARGIYPGFDKNNVLLAQFYLGGTGFSTRDMQDFFLRLAARLRTAPGVVEVSYADFAPLGTSSGPSDEVAPEGYVAGKGESMEINRDLVAPHYFDLLKIPLIEGRDFRDSDDRSAPPVMIVNQTFVRRYFNGGGAVGRRVRYQNKWFTVVGLAQDSKYFNVAEEPRPHFFAPFRQVAGSDVRPHLFVRVAGDPDAFTATLRREAAALDPNAGAFFPMPLTEYTEVTMLPQRVAASLLAAMGLISLVLAAVGLYSVMAYAVTQRTQEFGVRMALGARSSDVLRDVLLRGMKLTIAGLAAGIAGSFAVTHLVSSMLVNVGAADPVTFGGVAVFLAVVALAASYVPARRATQVDPMVALRCE